MPKHPLRLPLTGPGAVDRKDHGRAQEENDGEVEVVVAYIGCSAGLTLDECRQRYHRQRHSSLHQVVLAYYQRRWSDHVNLEVEVALSLNLRSQDE